jgi:hypothetical protein
MLNKTPEFDYYYVAYLKDDPAKEPIAASYSAPESSPKQRPRPEERRAIFEIREVSREEYERLKSLQVFY